MYHSKVLKLCIRKKISALLFRGVPQTLPELTVLSLTIFVSTPGWPRCAPRWTGFAAASLFTRKFRRHSMPGSTPSRKSRYWLHAKRGLARLSLTLSVLPTRKVGNENIVSTKKFVMRANIEKNAATFFGMCFLVVTTVKVGSPHLLKLKYLISWLTLDSWKLSNVGKRWEECCYKAFCNVLWSTNRRRYGLS